MKVTVVPEAFTYVAFDRSEIAGIAERASVLIGLPPDTTIRIEVDETTPLGRAQVASLDPVVLTVESGALEDPKRPRHLSPGGAADVVGRLLFRVRDRLDPGFGSVPADGDLTLPHSVAWDVYAIGRLVRLGHRHFDSRARRLYHFRNRHGFTDAADAAFARLWEGEGLRWSDIVATSDDALSALAS
ncbi:MAG: hypothetical protein ACRD0U_12610 [Acidimicrobiales bacterium]